MNMIYNLWHKVVSAPTQNPRGGHPFSEVGW